jgi:site-specific recombinase XerD
MAKSSDPTPRAGRARRTPRPETAVGRHLQDLGTRNLRPGTIYQRRTVLGRLRRFLEPTELLDAHPEDLSAFLARASLKPESRATETSHVRQFYSWAVDHELLEQSPARHLRRPRVARRIPRPIERDDFLYAVDQAGERVRPWLMLAAYAGLRAGEIAQLRAEDIHTHLDPPVIIVLNGKGGRQRVIPIAGELLEDMATWQVPRHGWLFLRRDDQPGHLPPHLVTKHAAAHLRACGIDCTIHQLRHLFGTEMYRRTRDLRMVQELLGHANPATTAGYAAWSPTEAAKALEGLSYS